MSVTLYMLMQLVYQTQGQAPSAFVALFHIINHHSELSLPTGSFTQVHSHACAHAQHIHAKEIKVNGP